MSSHRGDTQSLISVCRKAAVMVCCSYCDTAPFSQTHWRCEYFCALLWRLEGREVTSAEGDFKKKGIQLNDARVLGENDNRFSCGPKKVSDS